MSRSRFVATYGEEAGKALLNALDYEVLRIDDSAVVQQVESYARSNPFPRHHQVFLVIVQHWLPRLRPDVGGRAMRYPDDRLEPNGPSLAKQYSAPMRALAEIIRMHQRADEASHPSTPDDITIVFPESEERKSSPHQVKVLFWAADPTDQTRLRLTEEYREIEEKIRQSDGRDRLEFHAQLAVRVTDLQDALLRVRPNVVHFSGHGNADSLCFEDANGMAVPIGSVELSELFYILKENICVVVLNACFSELQAEAIAKHIDCTIGMNDEIEDVAAIAFAAAFYRAVGYGQSIQTAYELACHELKLLKIPAAHKPQLKTRAGVDAGDIRLVDLS